MLICFYVDYGMTRSITKSIIDFRYTSCIYRYINIIVSKDTIFVYSNNN